VAGADTDQNRGFSYDHLVPVGTRIGGGTLLQHGEFVQADARLGAFQFFAGARHQYTGQDRQFFSPSAGFAYGHGKWRGRGATYRAYRAPTLNELYRQFRAGNTVTLANGDLRPETLFGAEIGADYQMESGAIRVTAFRNAIGGLITNATLSSTPALITRQRQNGVDSESRGIEVNVSRRWRDWRGDAAYLFVDSRYATGPRIPQVAKNQGSAGVTFEHGGTLASASLRSFSSQFDDDLNQFRLPGFATVQFMARRRLARNFSASLEIENLLNRGYLTGYTPTPTIGGPRLFRLGIRWDGKL
jgi:outer membrane receptor protein involved in Fe transport